MPNMADIPQPKQVRKMAAAQKDDEDEGWGGAGDLLD